MVVYFSKSDYKSIRSVKNYIGKTYESHTDFLLKNGFDVDKCVFCDRYADTIVEIKEDTDKWYIDSFSYYKNNKVCRNKNCICSKINNQSKEWLIKVKGMSCSEAELFLHNKNKKSASTQKENGRFDEINNPFSKLYWKSKGYSDEEAYMKIKERSNKSVNTLRNNGWFDDKSNNPFSKEYWKSRGYSDEEAELKINSRIYNRPEYWKSRGYSDEDSNKLAKNSAKRDLKHFIEKYGKEEGTKKYKDIRDKISNYYSIKSIIEREKCSLEEAENIRENWIINTHTGKNSKYSKSSMLYFEDILSNIELPDGLLEKTYYAENEFGHYDKELNRYYFYDFVIEPLKICIEYNGIIWHPKSPNQDWIQPNTNKSAKEVYETDLRKKELLEREGYTYFIVWDDDINYNKKDIINTIKLKIEQYERN
jgi:hypothetical protein